MISEKDYAALNNAGACPIIYDGMKYPSVENAFQASRFESQAVRKKIAMMSPGEAANASRLKHSRSKDWQNRRNDIMYDLLKIKFQDPVLRGILLSTGNEDIVMKNGYHENEWGTCMCRSCAGSGANKLGRLLMELRAELAS